MWALMLLTLAACGRPAAPAEYVVPVVPAFLKSEKTVRYAHPYESAKWVEGVMTQYLPGGKGAGLIATTRSVSRGIMERVEVELSFAGDPIPATVKVFTYDEDDVLGKAAPKHVTSLGGVIYLDKSDVDAVPSRTYVKYDLVVRDALGERALNETVCIDASSASTPK